MQLISKGYGFCSGRLTYKSVPWVDCVQGASNPALFMRKVRDLTRMWSEISEGVLKAPSVISGVSHLAVASSL
jgi:hypothetical protein